MRAKIIALIFLYFFAPIYANADCPRDCTSSCCTHTFLGNVCDPTGTCQSACAVYNTTCGHPSIPIPSPYIPPNVPATIPLPTKLPSDPKVLIPMILTGGMVNPATVKATNDTIATVGKAISDIGKTAEIAGQDTVAEGGRAAREVGTAVEAISDYEKARIKGYQDSVSNALDRVREGKIVDSLWGLATEDLQSQNKAASAAALKSDLIRTVGSVASSVYGGPGGAAAYAAWLTYNQTGGDVNLALKVGIITGATSWAIATTGAIPSQDLSGQIIISNVGKKVAVTAAIGGLAVAAAGGNENAIRDGFLRAGAMVIIQEGYHAYLKHPLSDDELRSSKGNAYCLSDIVDCQRPPKEAFKYGKDGKFLGWDQRQLDPLAPHVGMGFPDSNITPTDVTWPTEGSPFMVGLSKAVPGSNAMAVFHDQWSLDWHMPPVILQATIYPAIVLTYNGTSAPLLEQVRTAAVASARKAAQAPSGGKYVVIADATAKVPIHQDQLETAYMCAKGNDSRSIAVEVDRKKKAFACRVIYRANLTRSLPWDANHETAYCDNKAKLLADIQIDAGYSCMVASATHTK